MWNNCRKFALIFAGSSKDSRKFRSAPNAISSNYITKAYYGDYIYSKEKQKSELAIVKPISEEFIKPKFVVKDSSKPYHLGPMDLPLLSWHYIQFGFLFNKPSKIEEGNFWMHEFLTSLKESLSRTLVHFYPLAGQLVLEVDAGKHESRVYVDCNKGPGARFIHATLDLTILNILSTSNDKSLVQSFFDLGEEVVNYDGHKRPLLCVQVTELIDGVFIACSINYAIIDGVLYWLFWNTWSKIHKGNGNQLCESCLPVYYHHWLPEGHDFPIPIPFTHRDEIVRKFKTPQLEEKMFHFSGDTIGRLKSQANEESNYASNISSFQALCALLWRGIIRANRLPHDQVVYNRLAANARERFNPPLPKNCFANVVQLTFATTTAGELLGNNLGWAASFLHQSVANLDDKSAREFVSKWLESPILYHHQDLLGYDSVLIGNSPKFDMYGHDFGLGKPITFRTGYANKGIGGVFACPGFNGGGSVECVIHLPSESMNALILDEEFTSFVSFPQ